MIEIELQKQDITVKMRSQAGGAGAMGAFAAPGFAKNLDKLISRCDTKGEDISQWDISGWAAALQ